MDAREAARHGDDPIHVGRTPIVVTLVHGTFATGAPWTKEGSALRDEITAALPGRHVVFDTFEWSGRNTHKARVKAGYALAAHVAELRTRYPRCKHFIVAHSHGGNVALFAHKHLPNVFHALGIATLGTPFLQARLSADLDGKSLDELLTEAPRYTEGVAHAIGWFLAFVSWLIYGTALRDSAFDAWYWAAAAAAATGGLAGYLTTLVFPAIARFWHLRGGKRAAVRLADAVRLAPMPATHVLSFIYPGDEAGRVLDALEVTTAAPTAAIGFIKENARHFLGGLYLLVIGLGVALVIAKDIVSFDDKALSNALASGFAFIVLGTLYALVLLAALRYVLSLLRGHPAGFGWERPSIHAHVAVGVAPEAEGLEARSYSHIEVPFTAAADAKRGLRHSGLYEDQRILKALAYWMGHLT